MDNDMTEEITQSEEPQKKRRTRRPRQPEQSNRKKISKDEVISALISGLDLLNSMDQDSHVVNTRNSLNSAIAWIRKI